MTSKKLWIIALLLLVGHLVIQYVFYLKIDLTDSLEQMNFVIDLLSNLILIFLIGAGLGGLVALISFRKRSFKDKFKITFPLLTSVFIIILIATFSYSIYQKKAKGKEFRSLNKYEDIQIPATLDCLTVYTGKFETEKSIIERTDKNQIQINKKTGDKKEYNIKWIKDCEYVLTSINDNSDKLRIKITSISTNEYGCYVLTEKNADKYPIFLTVKRIK